MKKAIAIFFVFVMIGSLALSASAATPKIDSRIRALEERQQQIADKQAELQQKRSQYQTKAEEYSALKEELFQKRDQMFQNAEKNTALVKDNNTLRLQLTQAIKSVKDSGAQLSEDTIAKLKDYNSQIQDIAVSIKDTKGQIKTILDGNKDLIKNKDYTGLDNAFDKIYTIQDWRNEQLTSINSLLTQMVSLIKV